MKKSDILNKISNAMSKVAFSAKKHSPELYLIGGLVCGAATLVLACQATTKVSDILDESTKTIESVHECEKNEALKEQYSPEDAKKDLAIVYIQTGVKLVKLYAPAAAFGILSLLSILASNDILRKRNVALAAAYATIDKSFKKYRHGVIERYGEEIDKELRSGIKAKKIEKTIVDEDGKEKKVKETALVADENFTPSGYSRLFDASNPNYQREAEYNRMFLTAEQNYANDLLRARGHLFLNEVYDRLGFERTRTGQVVGWVYDPENEDIDSYVDFGITDITRKDTRNFINGDEPAVWLDFNVDGYILDNPKAYDEYI